MTRPRVAPLSLEAAFFGPRRLSACGPSEGCSGGDAFRSPVGKRAVSPPEMVSHVYTGARPLCRALLQGAPSQCSSQLGGLPADGRDSAQPCPLLPTQPRPLSGPNGVAPRTPALRRCQDSLCSGCLGDGESRGARGVSQRWGGVWRTEAGRWALATGEDIAGRADTGRAMPGGPPPVPWASLGI